ncbi:translation initiation factor IF-1 [Candidatus Woesebacteria bacterium RIFCSPHIGHO2_01_FULL_44_21]|uniref:Translation initiation factor IF-1 n=1 Tax=Candidatus Woesebacteria bacterium RIFCSPHIGHO2_01_FULL_44_21 TaxID=1802503 RepID=A0A1F7Z1M0_9BACT|nr:MAG: translation initiation factor IF-1 [Candidatus Woesebacteria bacterium RIFCSPHIGHO2_01_FULL_44_21]OGM71467.1 MAG: translation initiation factor IF-1 [Candidatus Woesebacteria bacterium RIFCSPLOWO2_01_FULL_44_24b]
MDDKKNTIIDGEIVQILPNTMFRVAVAGREIIGVPSGKMRRGFMRLMPGQRVKIELTPYDENRGRIISKA